MDNVISFPRTAESASSWAALFLGRLPEDRRARFATEALLESALKALLSDATSRSPQLDCAAFLIFVAAGLSPQVTDCAALALLRIGDLLLVYGFNRGDAEATKSIESQYLPQVVESLHSYALSASDVSEVKQFLRHRLWASGTPQSGVAPYSGRGALLDWLRVTAIREAGRLLKQQRGLAREVDDGTIDAGQITGSPELELLKQQYRAGFRQAFDAALAALDNKERNLLRYSYLNNLSIDEIAVIYRIHRATAARWLNQIREKLFTQTRKNLQKQGTLDGVNIEELMQLIWSQLEVSIRRHLVLQPE